MRLLLTTALLLAASSAFARPYSAMMVCELDTLAGDHVKIESGFAQRLKDDGNEFTFEAPAIYWNSKLINFTTQYEDIFAGKLTFTTDSNSLQGQLIYRDFKRTYYAALTSIHGSALEYEGKIFFKAYTMLQLNENGTFKTIINNEVANCYLK